MFFRTLAPPVQRAGRYAVTLRIPAEGLFSGEEVDIEFRVVDESRVDPVDGPAAVVRAKVSALVTMPSMASMPPARARTHAEGVPGDYGLVVSFPHGGGYRAALTIDPPGDKPFTVTFDFEVGDDRPAGRKPAPKPFVLEASPKRTVAGKPTPLALRVRQREGNRIVTEFDTVHTQKLHLILVREDLGEFFHEHPKPSASGTFTQDFTFPSAGKWVAFADCAPKDAGSQILFAPILVDGPSARREPLVPQSRPTAQAGGLKLTLETTALVAGKSMLLTFGLRDDANKPVEDLEPWLGALAHLILIESDAKTFVHSHPDEADPKNGVGGRVSFLARFPRPGVYRGWFQCQRRGVVQTLSFTVKVGRP